MQELRTICNKRDGENIRLREQRDQLNTELQEHRARAAGQGKAFIECKTLLDSREVGFLLSLLLHYTYSPMTTIRIA